ncbi:MAG: hypothetical protein WCG27_08440 [Pseudomonadota bacterium]
MKTFISMILLVSTLFMVSCGKDNTAGGKGGSSGDTYGGSVGNITTISPGGLSVPGNVTSTAMYYQCFVNLVNAGNTWTNNPQQYSIGNCSTLHFNEYNTTVSQTSWWIFNFSSSGSNSVSSSFDRSNTDNSTAISAIQDVLNRTNGYCQQTSNNAWMVKTTTTGQSYIIDVGTYPLWANPVMKSDTANSKIYQPAYCSAYSYL